MRTVAIIGTGLIGGSFGLALRAAGFDGEILGVSSPPAIAAAERAGAIDRSAALPEAAAAADLVFLAQPVLRIIDTLPELNSHVRSDALVTDAGSTKLAIVEAAAAHLTRCSFIGGHPMAGSEKTGADAADAALFRDRPWVLTPRSDADGRTPSAAELLSWLQRFGARLVIMDPAVHDRVVAFTSHLPQLASTALAAALHQANSVSAAPVFGPGLLDMTRVALSSFDLWNGILSTNREAITGALDAYVEKVTAIRDALASADYSRLRALFEQGQQLAARLRQRSG